LDAVALLIRAARRTGRGGLGWGASAWTSARTGKAATVGTPSRRPLTLGLGRLGGIGPQQTVFQRCPVEAANDGVHFICVRRFDKREAFRLLRFGIADDLNRVRDQVLGGEPAPDIVRSDPSGQVAQKDGETHSIIVFNSVGGVLLRGSLP